MIRVLIVLAILNLFLSSNYSENTNNKQKAYTPGTNYKKYEISKKQSELTKDHEREVYACFMERIPERYHSQIFDFVINYNNFWDYGDEGTEVHYSYRYNNVEQRCAGIILFTP